MSHEHDHRHVSRASEAFQLTSPRPDGGADREEIHRFKSDIDLRSFALSKGYQLHEKDCTRTWTALRRGADEIVVGRGKHEHWCYFSHSDATDRGSIVDFALANGAKSWKEVFEELREWTGKRREQQFPIPVRTQQHTPDRSAMLGRIAAAREPQTHPYLEARGLTADTLAAPRFRGTWKEAAGPHREVLFLHRDEHGLSGAEVKNQRYTGFTPGGTKGLWLSNTTPADTRLVITESAIDALSYHQVNPHPRTRYASFAGQPTAKQLRDGEDGKPGLLSAAISWMPAGSTIVVATDNDKAGHNFAAQIAELGTRHPNVTFERHVSTLGKDWNDHLQALARARTYEPSKQQGLER